MEKKSIVGYFYFGTCVRYLQDAADGYHIFGDSFVLANINRFLDVLDSLELTVTKIAADDLVKFRNKLAKIKDKDSKLSTEQSQELHKLCREIRLTLESELVTHEAYIVTPKRFDTNKLLNDVGSLMSPGVFSALPEITKYDLMEAGKCIAFERPTAAAFHLLRATEAVLRHFYYTLIRTKRVPNLLWGDMVQDLRTRKKPRNIPLFITT